MEDIDRILAAISDPGVMQRFLDELLTPAERRNIILRWTLMRDLAAGVSQRDIATRLGISLCKITRGAKVLKRADSVSRRLLEKGSESVTGTGFQSRAAFSDALPSINVKCEDVPRVTQDADQT